MKTTISRKSNRVAATVTALVLLVGGVVTAQSASASNNCDQAGKACLWGYTDFTAIIARKSGGANLSNLTGSGIANETASWGNDSSYYGCLYDNTGGTGARWTINPLSSFALGLVNRDRGESWKLNGTSC